MLCGYRVSRGWPGYVEIAETIENRCFISPFPYEGFLSPGNGGDLSKTH